jgi:hypothetical protein
MRWHPVDAHLEGGAGAEEATVEGVEEGKEVLSGLRAGIREGGDSGLAICEDVDVG